MNYSTYIFIDGSYYIFYRYFALLNWWKLQNKDNPDEMININENPKFIKRFIKLFKSKIVEIPKMLKLDEPIENIKFIVGLDCKRENIWRNSLYSKYKFTRDNNRDDKLNPGSFFKMIYENDLFTTIEGINIDTLYHQNLEADDCIAISSKVISKKIPNSISYIITSDTDYLQIKQHNIHLYNLKYKTVNTIKNSLGCPNKDLLYKIILGDKSDNIPSVFKKCGVKTALKYINNIDLFEKDLFDKLTDDHNPFEQYKLNRRLIDFNQIPQSFQEYIENETVKIIN